MKKKFSIILFCISFFYLNTSYAENLIDQNEFKACSKFYNAVKNDELPFLKGAFPSEVYEDFGFFYKFRWHFKKKEWIADKDKNGNLIVGDIYSKSAQSSLESGDSIIKINEKRINNTDDFNEAYAESDQIKLELKDKNGQTYFAYLKREKNKYTQIYYSLINFNVSDIDLKKSFYETSINHEFVLEYSTIDNTDVTLHEYTKLGHKYLIGKFSENDDDVFVHVCDPNLKQFEDSQINKPHDIEILNLLKNDLDLQKIEFQVIPYKSPPNTYDSLRVVAKINSVQRVKNNFNLKSFPFDKQILKYKIVDDNFNFTQRRIYPSEFTHEALNEFIKIDDIPGWEKNSYQIKNIFHRDSVDKSGSLRHGIMIEIELERKHGYYIFKVIFPIILILVVCWSVVWINPKEIEARLTITIVCLLSLIAYNFVIDEELPKLEYLTVMDWIVLTSYVYATIPNFLSIYSFANISRSPITDKVDSLSKKFGLSSYLIIILFIVFLNANLNPSNSSAIIGWMSFR